MKWFSRSLIACVSTLIMCAALLIGMTFAWFSVSVTNSGNTIAADWTVQDVSSAEDFSAKCQAGGRVYLSPTANLESVTVPENCTVTLYLNEKTIQSIAVEGTLIVTGSGKIGSIDNSKGGTVRLYGGTYEFDPTQYVPVGYAIQPDGDTYTVTKAE